MGNFFISTMVWGTYFIINHQVQLGIFFLQANGKIGPKKCSRVLVWQREEGGQKLFRQCPNRPGAFQIEAFRQRYFSKLINGHFKLKCDHLQLLNTSIMTAAKHTSLPLIISRDLSQLYSRELILQNDLLNSRQATSFMMNFFNSLNETFQLEEMSVVVVDGGVHRQARFFARHRVSPPPREWQRLQDRDSLHNYWSQRQRQFV